MYLLKKDFYKEDDLIIVNGDYRNIYTNDLTMKERTLFTKSNNLWSMINIKIPIDETNAKKTNFYNTFKSIITYHTLKLRYNFLSGNDIKPKTEIADKYLRLLELTKGNESRDEIIKFLINMVNDDILDFDDVMYEVLDFNEEPDFNQILEILQIFSIATEVKDGYHVFSVPFLYPVDAFLLNSNNEPDYKIINNYFQECNEKASNITKRYEELSNILRYNLSNITNIKDDTSYLEDKEYLSSMEQIISDVIENENKELEGEVLPSDNLEEIIKVDEQIINDIKEFDDVEFDDANEYVDENVSDFNSDSMSKYIDRMKKQNASIISSEDDDRYINNDSGFYIDTKKETIFMGNYKINLEIDENGKLIQSIEIKGEK